MKIAVVIPAYEADGRLHSTLLSIPQSVWLRIVVDDGSVNKVSVPEGVGAIVLRHEKNLGLGAAIMSGYKEAKRLGADIAVVLGADGQMDPNDLDALVSPIIQGRADYVTGDRLSHPDCKRSMPRVRFWGVAGLTFLTRLVTWRWDLMDSQCGYTALRLSLLDKLPLSWLYPRYGFPNDMLAAVVGVGGRIVQVPTRPIYNGGRSGLKPAMALFLYPLILARSIFVRLLSWAKTAGGRPCAC